MPQISSKLKREELLRFISIYQLNPYAFKQEDVDVLYDTAKDKGIPFERDPSHVQSSLVDKVGQLSSGFVSGFSTIHVGEDPETTGEAIARNIGHLFGFMGVIPGVGTVGSLLTKGTMMGARGLKAAKLISDVKKVDKVASAVQGFTSVPMGIAKAVVGKAGNIGKVKALGETSKYLKTGTVARDMLKQSAELGIGSGIASWQGGIDEMFDATIAGGATGAVFGALSNVQLQGMGDILKARQMFKNPATMERANKVARTALMSAYTGLHSTMADEPIEMQVYQYGLGAFFGVQSVPASVRAAGKFIRGIAPSERLNPERADGFKVLNEPVQKEILRQAALMWGRKIKSADEASEGATWGSVLLAQTFPKIIPGEKYDKSSTKDILEIKNKAKQIAKDLENGIDTFPSENLVEVRPKAEPTFKPESLYSRMDNWLEKEAATKKGKKFSKKEQLELQKEHKQIAEDLSLGDSMPSLSNWISGKFESFKDRMLKKYGNTDIKNQTPEEKAEFKELQSLKKKADYFIKMVLKKPKKPKSEQLDIFRQHAVITKEMKDGKVEIQYRDGTKETIDAERLRTMGGEKMTEDIARELAGATKADIDSETPVKEVVFDHEDNVARLDDPLQKFLSQAFRPEHDIKGIKERVNKRADEILKTGGENAFPEFEDVLVKELGINVRGDLAQNRSNLKRWWKQKAQFHLGKQTYWDGFKIVPFGTINPLGTRIVEKRTPSLYDKVTNKYKEARTITRRAMNFFVTKAPGSDRVGIFDIFGTNFDGSPFLGRKDLAKIFLAADKDNYYVVSGVKDKQRAILHPYAFETINEARFKLKGLFGSAKKWAPELEGLYKASKDEFTRLLVKGGGDKNKSGKIYEKIISSNIEYLERINGGLPIEVILDPKNKGKFITDVMKLNKRTQLIDSGELRWNPTEYETEGGIKVAMVNSIPEGFSQSVRGQLPIKVYKELAKHHLDGIFILNHSTFDSAIKDGGFPADASILKGSLVYSNPTQGLILGKYAYYRAGEGTNSEMSRHGLQGLIWDTATKQTGLRDHVNIQIATDAAGGRRMSFYKAGKPVSTATKANFNKEDGHFISFDGLTLNPTVFESPRRLMKDTRSVRQVVTQLKPEQILGEHNGKSLPDALADDMISPAYKGTEKGAKFTEDYLSAVKSKDSKKIAEMDSKLNDINMEEIGVEQKLDVLFGKDPMPSRLYSKMWEHILKLDNKNEIDLDMELLTELNAGAKQDYINTKRQTFSTVHRWLKIARDNGGITPMFMNHKLVRRYAENVFKNYMTSSLIRPVMEHSGKAIGTPFDPMLQARFKREKGHFYLYDSWKSKMIKWGDGETTLEKAFEDYQNVKSRYDKLSIKEKRDDKNVIKNQLESMTDDLSWAIIRVPSDSVSGTRILKFGGFVGRKGAGILLDNKDMIALGGMDLDIDSVFLYQHLAKDPVLNKKLFEQIRNNRNEWVGKDGKLIEVKADSRKKELDIKERIYEDNPSGYSKQLFELFDPISRWSVAQGAAAGNARIGSAANLTRRLGTFYNLLTTYGNKVVTGIGVDFDYKLNKDKGFLLRLFGRDAMNWAADAGDTAGLYSHPYLENVLLRKLFTAKPRDITLSFTQRGKKKYSTNLDKRDFAKNLKKHTVYGILKRMDDALNGRDWTNNRSFTLIESLRELNEAKSELSKLGIELQGVWYKAADKLADLYGLVDRSNFSFINDKASFRLNKIFDKVVGSEAGKFVLASTFRHRIKTATDPPNLNKLGKLHPDLRREIWKDLISQDKWDILSSIMLTKTARAHKAAGGKFSELENIANQSEKYLREYHDILKHEKTKRKAGKESARFESMERLHQSMAKYKNGLKSPLMAEYFEKYIVSSLIKQDVPLNEARIKAQKKVDDAVDNKSRSDAEAELDNVDKHWWRTNITRLGLADSRIISDRVMTDYIINYNRLGKMSDEALSDAEVSSAVKEALGIKVEGVDPKKVSIIEGSRKLNDAIENESFTSEFLNKLKDLKKLRIRGKAVTPEVKQELSTLKRQLTWIFAKHPDLVDKFFPSKFVGISGKPDRGILKQIPSLPESATLEDVRDFVGFFKLRYNRLFETDITPEKLKEMPVLRRHFMMWHSTVGEKLEKADMKWYPLRNVLVRGPGGKPFNAEARIPISTLGMQDVVANKVIMLKDAAERRVHTKIKDVFEYVDKIGHKGDKLYEIATDLHQEKLYDGTKGRRLFKTNADAARKELAKFKNEMFSIPVGKKTQKMTAEEVVFKIRRDIRRFTEDFYKERVNDRSGKADEKYLIWKDRDNKELDFEATMKGLAEPMLQGVDPPMAPLNTMLRIAYERAIQIVVTPEKPPEYLPNSTKKEREEVKAAWEKEITEGLIKKLRVVDNPNKEQRSRLLDYLKGRDTGKPWDGGISKIQEGYYPRGGHIRKEVEEHIEKRVRDAKKKGATDAEIQSLILRLRSDQAESLVEDGLLARGSLELAMREDVSLTDLETMGIFSRPGHALRRGEEPIPNWDKSRGALYKYSSQMISAYYNNLFALMSHRLIEKFEKDSPLGKHTKDWKMFMQNYTMNVLGYPSVFPKEWLNRPSFPIKETPYYWMSDHLIHKKLDKVSNKYFKGKKFWKEGDATDMSRKLAAFSNFDAKYQLMSLLSHSKTMIANMFGGTETTIASTGWRYWKDAGNLDHLKRIIPDVPKGAGWDWFQKFAEEAGAVESFFVNELRFSPHSKSARTQKYFGALRKKWNKEGKYEKMSVGEIGKEFGVHDTVINFAAQAMRWSERKLRSRAFWAHYLKWADVFDQHAISRDAKHPWIMQLALRGVENTQFLYHNAARPAFARTNLGRVYARFQTWAWNSMKFRKDIYKNARAYGFRPGSEEMNQFKRIATGDLFIFSLASAFPFSMFDSALPPPMSYVMDFSELMFGDERTRDRAFFGTLPGPLAPIQAISPPSARFILGPLGSLLKGDWDRWATYQIYTWFPFGRIFRDVVKTIDNPSMAIERLTGFPIFKLQREVKERREEETMIPGGFLAPTPMRGLKSRREYEEAMKELDPWEIPPDYKEWSRAGGSR